MVSVEAANELVGADEPGHAEELADGEHPHLRARVSVHNPLHGHAVGVNTRGHFLLKVLVEIALFAEHSFDKDLQVLILVDVVVSLRGQIIRDIGGQVHRDRKVKLKV